jgi:DNA-binding transcriptional ArsR family regulator
VLREAGLVTERVAGTRHLYRARPEGLAELREFLATMWPEALDRLKARAEETAAAAEMATIAGPTGGSGQ